MNIIVSLIIGAVVGWLASMVMETNAQMGSIANIIVGIVGSALGFWLAGMLGLTAQGPIMAWVVAIAGACVLIALLKMTRVLG